MEGKCAARPSLWACESYLDDDLIKDTKHLLRETKPGTVTLRPSQGLGVNFTKSCRYNPF